MAPMVTEGSGSLAAGCGSSRARPGAEGLGFRFLGFRVLG